MMDKFTKYSVWAVSALTLLLMVSAMTSTAHAQIIKPASYTVEDLVDAIYTAEGGSSATYLYGIRSVEYDNEADARRICRNTVTNNIQRYINYGSRRSNDFIEFLAGVYAPLNAENDPKGLNHNWERNVRSILKDRGKL